MLILKNNFFQSPVNGEDSPRQLDQSVAEDDKTITRAFEGSLEFEDPLQSFLSSDTSGVKAESSAIAETSVLSSEVVDDYAVLDDVNMTEHDIGELDLDTGLTNLPPVPSNMYNISSVAAPDSMDLFEPCMEEKPHLAALSLDSPHKVAVCFFFFSYFV